MPSAGRGGQVTRQDVPSSGLNDWGWLPTPQGVLPDKRSQGHYPAPSDWAPQATLWPRLRHSPPVIQSCPLFQEELPLPDVRQP